MRGCASYPTPEGGAVEAPEIDPVEFRDGQRTQWNQAAQGWRKWSDVIDDALSGVSDRLVELAGIGPGTRVLDVAAGYGEPSLTAARAAGAEGGVVASDISAEMLAFGRERAAAAGVGTIEFVEAGAMDLDFPAASFDAAVSRFGIIFEPDGEGAAARVREFLRPGSRFAIASWGLPEQVPFLAIPMKTAMERLEVPPPPPGTPGPLSRPTPDALSALLEGGGFTEVEVKEMEVTFTLDSAEQFAELLQETVPPLVAMIAPRPPDVQAQTWDAITDAFQAHASDDGSVTLSNLVLLAAGRA